MDTDLAYSIINRIKKEEINCSITSNLLGESLLHPEAMNIYSRIIFHEIPFSLTTNSNVWKPQVFDMITNKGSSLYLLIFSQNGLYYEKSKSPELCMKGFVREKSKFVIDQVMKMKNKKGSKFQVGIKITRRGQDYEEIEEIIQYWLEYGMDFVSIGKSLVSNEGGMRIFPCRYPDDMALEIRSTGDSIACGWHTKVVNEFQLTFGKVPLNGSIVEFYNNEKYREFRKRNYTGDFPDVCKKCSIAYTGDGFRGSVKFRHSRFPRRKIYFHEDYANIFYSYKKKYSRISFLREWKPDQEIVDEISREGRKLYWK
jgi:MoaA/NifB/PqqE/SkfB family radical SAM enzyme